MEGVFETLTIEGKRGVFLRLKEREFEIEVELELGFESGKFGCDLRIGGFNEMSGMDDISRERKLGLNLVTGKGFGFPRQI